MSRQDSDAEQQPLPSRRTFIVHAAGLAALLPAAGTRAMAAAADAAANAGQSAADPAAPAPNAGYTLFGPEESAFVEMLVDVMCPADA